MFRRNPFFFPFFEIIISIQSCLSFQNTNTTAVLIRVNCIPNSILHIIKLFYRLPGLFIPHIHIDFIAEPVNILYDSKLLLLIELCHTFDSAQYGFVRIDCTQTIFLELLYIFWSGGSLDRLYDSIGNKPADPMSSMFVAAMREWKRTNILKSKTDRGLRGVSLQQRIEKAMTVSMDKELDELDTRMGFLASTGSVAPLVGLFGTVWGIINSFNAIAATQSNSLSAIAPGIAEALFTTAFGLIAAIPAVVAYNKISSDIDRYANRLENFMAEFSSILSREIDDTAIKADMAGE